jgi:hypothetical protein
MWRRVDLVRRDGWHKSYTAPHPRIRHSSWSPQWEPQILHKYCNQSTAVFNEYYHYNDVEQRTVENPVSHVTNTLALPPSPEQGLQKFLLLSLSPVLDTSYKFRDRICYCNRWDVLTSNFISVNTLFFSSKSCALNLRLIWRIPFVHITP